MEGCGAPNLKVMHSSVSKRVINVLLVDSPRGYNRKTLLNQLQLDGIVSNVEQISANQVAQKVTRITTKKHNSLIVIVRDGIIDLSHDSFMTQHTDDKFIFVGTSMVPGNHASDNISLVVPNANVIAYTAGWFAASLAGSSLSTPSIGLIDDKNQVVTKSSIEAMLAGAYADNPNVNINSISLQSTIVQPTNGPFSVNPVLIPPIVIVARPLTNSEVATLRANQTFVISLCAQPLINKNLAVVPNIPRPESVITPISKYASGQSLQSKLLDATSPFISMPSNIPSQTQASVVNLENVLMNDPNFAVAAWAQLPLSVRSKWNTMVKMGL